MTGSVPSEELRAGFQLGDLKPACRGILTALGEGIFRTSKTVGSGEIPGAPGRRELFYKRGQRKLPGRPVSRELGVGQGKGSCLSARGPKRAAGEAGGWLRGVGVFGFLVLGRS